HATVSVQGGHMGLQLATLKSFEPARRLNKKVRNFVVLAFGVAIKARKANTSAQWPCLSFNPFLFFGGKSFVSSLYGRPHLQNLANLNDRCVLVLGVTEYPLQLPLKLLELPSENRGTDEVGINHTLQVKGFVDVAKHHSDELFPVT